jgi:uncharacterized membrane protein YeiH
VLIALDHAGAPQWLGLVVAASVATSLRLLAMWQDWKIPSVPR